MPGLESTGFSRKRQSEIIDDIIADLIAAYGNINTDPDGVIGLIVGVLSQAIGITWEELENVYYSQYPASAEGFNLDNVCALIGLTRLQATRTAVVVAIWGDPGTDVSTGFQGSVSGTGEKFELIENITISISAAAGANIEVVDPPLSEVYTLTINGIDYQYDNTGGGATAAQIAASLASDIDSGEANVTAASDGAVVELLATDGETAFTIGTLNANHFTLNDLASFGNFEALNTGPVLALAETLTVIETPVSGVDSIINYIDGILGRDMETDVELRERRAESLALVGSGTIDAIRAHLLQDVENVVGVYIEENRTDSPDGDLTPHSFKTVILGGADQDIAEKIWELKPAGIETIGTTYVFVTDSCGNSQKIWFSRPTEVKVWIDVQMTENPEEEFPEDGVDAVRQAILELGQEHSIGDDIIIQKFYAAVYSVQGIATASITWETSDGPYTPPYGNTGNITIDSDEIGTFDLSRITATMS